VQVGKEGKKVEMLTWNTGDRKKGAASEDNTTHAEHQFAEWLSLQKFRSHITAISVSMTSPNQSDSPCPSCADDLKWVARFTPGAAEQRTLTFTGLYTSKVITSDAAQRAVIDLSENGWTIASKLPGEEERPLHRT